MRIIVPSLGQLGNKTQSVWSWRIVIVCLLSKKQAANCRYNPLHQVLTQSHSRSPLFHPPRVHSLCRSPPFTISSKYNLKFFFPTFPHGQPQKIGEHTPWRASVSVLAQRHERICVFVGFRQSLSLWHDVCIHSLIQRVCSSPSAKA